MRQPRRFIPRPTARGFTLPELISAGSMAVVISTAAWALLVAGQQQWATNDGVIITTDQARQGLEWLAKDLRSSSIADLQLPAGPDQQLQMGQTLTMVTPQGPVAYQLQAAGDGTFVLFRNGSAVARDLVSVAYQCPQQPACPSGRTTLVEFTVTVRTSARLMGGGSRAITNQLRFRAAPRNV